MDKWEKAWFLVMNQKIWLDKIVQGEKGEGVVYYLKVEIDNKDGVKRFHNVRISNYGMGCDCDYSGLYPDGLCSHKIAAILYLTLWKKQQLIRKTEKPKWREKRSREFWEEFDKIREQFKD